MRRWLYAIMVMALFAATVTGNAKGAEMTRRYYIAPWTVLYAIGGGQFSLTDPGGARQVQGSRVLLWGTWLRDVTGHYAETIKPRSARGQAKGTCMSYVEAPDVDPLALHALIAADTEIAAAPWTPDNLDATFGTLTAGQQSQVRSALSAVFMDDQWIAGGTTFRRIMSYILHVLFGAQGLGSDYPDGPLTSRWNSLAGTRQVAINAWLVSVGRPAVTGNPTIRDVVNSIAQVDYGTNNPTMGGVQFGAWTP
ncbi:MAG TPA: hypothetical protein VII92_00545 [Anaerolineae bacterium]